MERSSKTCIPMVGLQWTTLGVILTLTLAAIAPCTFAAPSMEHVDAGHQDSELMLPSRNPRSIQATTIAAFQVIRNLPLKARRVDILKFDEVETNIGNHYNTKTGEFTTPVAGVYFFSLQLLATAGTYVQASIQKTASVSSYSHYVNVMKAVSDRMGAVSTAGGQGTAVAVLRLEPGQKVTVSVSWIAGKEVIGGGRKTSFSGFLLR